MSIHELLKSEAAAFGITLNPRHLEKLETYCNLLQRWNSKMNLISVSNPLELARFHFLESLFVEPHIPPAVKEHLDIGSGAGFPAIPLRVLRETLSQTLLESRQKKALFLKECARELTLPNVNILAKRVEDFLSSNATALDFDLVTARAVNLPVPTTDQLIGRTKKGCLIILWHGESAPMAQHLRQRADLEDTFLQRVPYSRNRYVHIFRKI